MAWRDELRPASFRTVPFYIDGSQFNTGRRVAVHEFPDRDISYPEDLGNNARGWKVDGHLIGDDYLTQKRAMIEAVEKKGPGELIHPFYGSLFVQCGAVSFDEDNREGGFVKVTFQFYEAGDNRFPLPIEDKAAVLDEKADATLDASKGAFDESFSITGLPGFAVDSARLKVTQFADALSDATKGIRAEADKIADLAFDIRNLKAEVNTLLQSPSVLSSRLQTSFKFLMDALSLPEGKAKAAKLFFQFGSVTDAVIVGATPIRVQERLNRDQLNSLIQKTAIANYAKQVSEIPFSSVTEARAERTAFADTIDEQLFVTEDNATFQTLKDVNAQVAKILPDIEAELPDVKEYSVQETVPAIVVAYDIYEDIELEADIITRNAIANPNFINGGTVLEVVSNV